MTDHSPAGLPLPSIEPFTGGGFKQVLTKVGLRAARSYMHRMQGARATQFEQVGLEPDRIVFFGDSITEQGLWSEWFEGAVNRGIGGETTPQLLARLDTAVREPRAVFVLVGTNDLAMGHPAATIVADVARLLDELERRAPGTPVVLQSIMPRAVAYADRIRSLNRAYRTLADQRPTVSYLDLWPALAAGDGSIRAEFTFDDLHLVGAGYAAWVEVLRPVVDGVRDRP